MKQCKFFNTVNLPVFSVAKQRRVLLLFGIDDQGIGKREKLRASASLWLFDELKN